MNRWKLNKSWFLVWGSSLLVAVLILYIGYQGVLSESTKEKTKTIEKVQTVAATVPVSVKVQNEKSDGKAGQVLVQKEKQERAKNTDQGILEDKKVMPKPAVKEEGILNVSDFSSPVRGRVLRGLGNYYSEALQSYLFHGGTDYAEPEGTVIRATHGGKVVFAGPDPILGEKVTLDCSGGWIVIYGGLENLSVKIGQNIEMMDKIGQVGFTPGSEGSDGQSQLHYEVWHNNEVQSPK